MSSLGIRWTVLHRSAPGVLTHKRCHRLRLYGHSRRTETGVSKATFSSYQDLRPFRLKVVAS